MNETCEELTVDQEVQAARPKRGVRRGFYLICVLLIVITVAVYWQVYSFDFVTLDDKPYVIQNVMVNMGLKPWSLQRAFILPWQDNYIPLIWVSYMVDHDLGAYVLDSTSPGIYHVSNVIIHIINTLLLFGILASITGSRWKSAFVAALFAVHPLHVESVAWIAERKDTLSTFFWLLTTWAYVRYTRTTDSRSYLLVVLLFALGLLAKPMLVTLPVVLILMDFWPLKRMSSQDGHHLVTRSGLWRVVSEKSSLYVLAAVGAYITFNTQRTVGAVLSLGEFPLGERLANAAVSSIRYIGKMFYPRDMTLYWHPHATLPVWQTVLSTLLLMGITAFAGKAHRRYPYALFGWLWYLITLLPVIGIVQVGWQAMADRYTYVPLIGIFIVVAWGIPDLLQSRTRLTSDTTTRLLAVASIAATLVLLPLTYRQIGYWRNDATLFGHAVKAEPTNPLSHYSLGTVQFQQKDYQAAADEFRTAIKLKPDYWTAMYGLASTLYKVGHRDDAKKMCREIIRRNPQETRARLNLGLMLMDEAEYDQAISLFKEVLRIRPNHQRAMQALEDAENQKSGGGWTGVGIGN